MKEEIKIIDFDIYNVIGIENEEHDSSVGYYKPFELFFENDKKEQLNLSLDYDRLIDLMLLLKPYLEEYEEMNKRDEEQYKEYLAEQI